MIPIQVRLRESIQRENLRTINRYGNGVRPAGLDDHERNKYLGHRLPADLKSADPDGTLREVRRAMGLGS